MPNMSPAPAAQPPSARRWPWLVVACVPFGVLMVLRETSPSIWLRAAVVAFAVVFLAFNYRRLRAGE